IRYGYDRTFSVQEIIDHFTPNSFDVLNYQRYLKEGYYIEAAANFACKYVLSVSQYRPYAGIRLFPPRDICEFRERIVHNYYIYKRRRPPFVNQWITPDIMVHLRQQPVVMSFRVGYDFSEWCGTWRIYHPTQDPAIPWFYHSMVVLGYDTDRDTLEDY
ncbi:hypothetical protein PanWU01x14_239930, partial [Parasponia andersonii]